MVLHLQPNPGNMSYSQPWQRSLIKKALALNRVLSGFLFGVQSQVLHNHAPRVFWKPSFKPHPTTREMSKKKRGLLAHEECGIAVKAIPGSAEGEADLFRGL